MTKHRTAPILELVGNTLGMVAFWAMPFLVTMSILSVSYMPPSGSKRIHVGAISIASIVLAAAGAGTFWWWGIAFDAADTPTITSGVDRAMVVGFWVGVVAFAVIMLIGTSAAVGHRRRAKAQP